MNTECPAIPQEYVSKKEIRGEISKDVSIHNCIVESSIHVNCICLTVKLTSLGHAMLLSSQHACRQFAVLKPLIDPGGWHSQQSFDTTLQSPRLQVSLFLAFRLYVSMTLVFLMPLSIIPITLNFRGGHTQAGLVC